MDSRERILASINHKEPDRIPIDLGATTSSGISGIAYNKLKKYLLINQGHTRIFDVIQQLAQPEQIILDKFKIDVINVAREFCTNDKDWYQIELPSGYVMEFPYWFKPVRDENGNLNCYFEDGTLIATMKESTTYFDQTYYPYINGYPEDFSDIEEAISKVSWFSFPANPWIYANEPDYWTELRKKALKLQEKSNSALVIEVGCPLLETGNYLRRMDNFLMDIYLEPNQVERLLDVIMQRHLKTLEKVCKAVGDIVDIVRFCDDLGTDLAPLMSPEIYRKIFKPKLTILCDYVKKHSKMHTLIHSCGSIYKLMPDIIEAGIEIFNPVQTTANEMDIVKLKKEFGKDITFWGGGCNTRSILNHAKPQEVKDYVKRQIEILAPGGGFVFNQEHNIMPDVPPENIVAMYEAVHEFSK